MIIAALAFSAKQFFLVEHEFEFTSANARSVSVAGTFNNWNKDADPLSLTSDGKTWKRKLSLEVGEHQYKFVVNGETWVTDPRGQSGDDGYGNINSFLTVVPPGFEQPAKLGDGMITKSGIFFSSEKGGLIYSPNSNRLRFLIKTRRSDVQHVRLTVNSKIYEMNRVAGDTQFDIFTASIPAVNPPVISYDISLNDSSSRNPEKWQIASSAQNVDLLQFTEATVPAWPKGTVFYQIFPDRFLNGDKSNDSASVEPWGSKPEYYNFMGGDLAGVSQKVNYFAELGISGIYFNPVFAGPSNHGYETTDYRLIEPRLGTNAEFTKLTRRLKSNGIEVVLDGVFNHSSVEFAPFKEIRDLGRDASTLDWFTIKSFPVEVKADPPYEAWAGFASLPKLNVMNPATKQYLFDSVDYWHSTAEIAGWRLDVANEVPMPFWREFRKHLKSKNPKAWIIGENWTDSSAWLKGDQWDSAMNYPVRGAIVDHIATGKTTSSQFVDSLMSSYLMYGPAVSRNMLNSLSTHDVPRFKFLAKESEALTRMGAVALFAWPGVPCVYYGDELGMTGGVDPDNRRAMRWDLETPQNSTLTLYKNLIKARRVSPALQDGEPVVLQVDDPKQLSSFARVTGKDVAIACFNRSQNSQEVELDLSQLKLSSDTSLVDIVSGKALSLTGGARLRLRLPAHSAALAVKSSLLETNQVQDNLTR